MSRRRNLPLDTLELILEGVELIVSANGEINGARCVAGYGNAEWPAV